VVSILLAFAIQAWWEARQERAREQETLSGLATDFAFTLAQLHRLLVANEDRQALIMALEAMADSELEALPEDSVALYEAALLGFGTFDARDGTLESLVASGDLGIIRDPHLRQRLMEWQSVVGDISEETDLVLSTIGPMRRRVGELGGPWRFPPESAHRGSAADPVMLARDPEVMAIARHKWLEVEMYLRQLEPLMEYADTVLGLIDRQLTDAHQVAALRILGPPDSGPAGIRGLGRGSGISLYDVWPGPVLLVAMMADGSERDMTFLATWTSSDTAVFALRSGIVKGRALGIGTSELCATLGAVRTCRTVTVVPDT
jgi:hypothetical protein